MLHSSEVVRCVRKMLDKFETKNVVLDPVMVSTSGHRLIEEEAIASLVSDLLPRARVITPNIPEAEILLGGEKLSVQKELPDAAKRLADKCGASVLLKAGHLTEEKLVDIFYDVEDGKSTNCLQLASTRKTPTELAVPSHLHSHQCWRKVCLCRRPQPQQRITSMMQLSQVPSMKSATASVR